MLQKKRFFGRSVLPNGDGNAAVGIPAEVRRDVGLEPGSDGDLVDMEYDREERTLTVHLPDNE